MKTGQVVWCQKHRARYFIERVHASQWHLSCTHCKFSRWFEHYDDATTAAHAHTKRTLTNHEKFLLDYRPVTKTGNVRTPKGTPFTTVSQETLFDAPPPF